ncbi:type III restriction protein res subunit [Candidatus Vecturithrix granuli]|uniref:Type III restriction protein res subunit n=1 Tax=Vecturithrix granuli TaxID=1499967 RepID=A0A081BUK2_VECG1|nr:type III restriction protein res subunit [Candidatus Vecturithrix granuli]
MRVLFDRGTLVLAEIETPAQIPPQFMFDNRVDRWRTPAYRYRAVIEYLVQHKIPYQDNARQYQELTCESRLSYEPHPYQQQAMQTWQASKFRGVIELPTGAGKSYVGQMAIELTRRSTLVVVPTIDLLHQWYSLLASSFGSESVGIIGGGYYEVNLLTVTTYQSAVNTMDRLGNRWGLLIFDECHHLPGEMYSHAAQMAIAPYRLALTATIERPDGRHVLLEDLIGPLVYRQGIKELAGDYLAEYEIKKTTVHLTKEEKVEYGAALEERNRFLEANHLSLGGLDGWRLFVIKSAQSQEGRRAMLAYHAAKKIALGTESKLRALEAILKEHYRDRVLIFTQDNDMAYTVSQEFLIPCITHQTDVKERRAILEAFSQGTYRFLVTSKALNEGVNVPEANVAVILSGSGSIREHVQRLGRILRRKQGKQAILYEIVAKGTVEEYQSKRRSQHDAYQ